MMIHINTYFIFLEKIIHKVQGIFKNDVIDVVMRYIHGITLFTGLVCVQFSTLTFEVLLLVNLFNLFLLLL